MTESKHTPAPWEFHGDATGRGLIVQAPGHRTRQVVALVQEVVGYEADTLPEAEANARLIAASPTMYEYIRRRADEGDKDAASIIAGIG